jgi:hypothetical protein
MPKRREDLDSLPTIGQTSFEDRYPWIADVLDGKVYELVAGEDFTVKTETMYQSLRGYAERRKLDIGIRTTKGNILLQNRNGK